MGVTERTIQRDIEQLEELGVPLDFEEDEYGKRYWRIQPGFLRTGALTLSVTEAISLHLAESMLRALAGTHLAQGLDSTQDKLRSLLPSKALAYFAELDRTLYVRRFASTDYREHAATVQCLELAIRREQTLQLTYRSLWRGETYDTQYDPYGLVIHLDDLFVVGHSHRAAAIRVLKVSRILGVEMTSATFERPADFNLEDLFRSSFGIVRSSQKPVEVAVRFRGVAAAVVEERIWHDSQRLEWLPTESDLFQTQEAHPDSLIATFQLSDLTEFKRWIKGFGDQALVLRPDWLREEMRAELRSSLEQYET